MFGNSPNGSEDMGKIVAEYHCDRLKTLIETSKGNIVCGGKVNNNIKYIEPTIIENPEATSKIMNEEIFGPILPLLTFQKIEECIDLINKKDKPLAIYYFGKIMGNPNKEKVRDNTSSGAFVVNEVMMHCCVDSFGFGGVGGSGYGRYGGYEGFKNASNPKSMLTRPSLNFPPFNKLNPPYT